MQVRTLYKDFQDHPNDQLLGQDRDALESYIREIHDQTERAKDPTYASGSWSAFARTMIKQIILDAIDYFGVVPGSLRFQVYCTGSLVKDQATPYSDVDGFIVWEDPKGDASKLAAIDKLQQALIAARNVFQRIFLETNQFSPDPLGITPFNFQGTVDELYEKLNTAQVPDVPTFVASINTAKPFFGDNSFLESLASRIAQNPQMGRQDSSVNLYRKVVEDFPGPRTSDKVLIKRDFLRPLDFFMMALRRDFGVSVDINSPLNTVQTVEELVMHGKISHEFADLIILTFDDALKLRQKRHLGAGKENDELELAVLTAEQQQLVRGLVDKMAILRGVAEQRLEALKRGESLGEAKLELLSLSNLPYKTTLYDRGSMVINPLPYVYNDPAREYFESQRAVIRQNLADVERDKETGNIEKIFKEITSVPAHLQYLSETLTYCFQEADIDKEGQITIAGEGVVKGQPLPENVTPVLDKAQFAMWCQILLQNAKSDLFDAEGNIHSWLKRLISQTRPGVVALDETEVQAQVEGTKKALLRAYFNGIMTDAIARNPVVAMTQGTPEYAPISAVINEVTRNCLNEASTHNIKELILDRHQQFKLALREFKRTVQGGVRLLTEIRSSTLDKSLIANIDHRLQRYDTLCRDIDHVASLPQQSSTLQSSFLHKSYFFFDRDFSQFEQDLKETESSLWTWVKEKFHSIRNTWAGIPDLILSKKERVARASDFFGSAKREYEVSSNAGAFDSPSGSPDTSPTPSRV